MSKNKKSINISDIIKKYEKEKEELIEKHKQEEQKIATEYKELLNYNMRNIIDTMQTEFIYELASQMDYWNIKDSYYKQSAKYRIEEIYYNIVKTMNNYSKMSNDKQVQKIYKMKKNKLLNEFNLNFKGE